MPNTYATLLIGLSSVLTASAAVTIDAQLFQVANNFGGAGVQSYAFFNTYSFDGDVVSVDVLSPNGVIRGGSSETSSSNFPTFQGLLDEIQAGPWTLTLARDVGASEPEISLYQFSVNLAGVVIPPSFSITSPANGANDVAPGLTSMQWTPPAGTYSSQAVSLTVGSSSHPTLADTDIGPADTNWAPPEPGLAPNTTYLFFAQYAQDLTGVEDVSISEPVDEFSNVLPDFTYTITVYNQATSVFSTVPEPREWALISGLALAGFVGLRRSRRTVRA